MVLTTVGQLEYANRIDGLNIWILVKILRTTMKRIVIKDLGFRDIILG